MEPRLRVVQDDETLMEQDHAIEPARLWREHAISDRWLVRGQDEVGRRGWFLTLSVTGLFDRRVGPFRSKALALETLENFLAHLFTEPLCELESTLSDDQACVVEGVSRIRRRS